MHACIDLLPLCSYTVADGLKQELMENDHEKDNDPEYRGGPDIIAGDIRLTPAQAAIYNESGWEGLIKSEAWTRSTQYNVG